MWPPAEAPQEVRNSLWVACQSMPLWNVSVHLGEVSFGSKTSTYSVWDTMCRTELNVMQKVHFPHAVQFLGACTISQPYMIVTEFLPGGSLTDLFRRVHRGTATHPNLKRATEMALDCSRGMTYLHAKKCVSFKSEQQYIPSNPWHKHSCIAVSGCF